jgi:hypothetical protein
MLLNPLRLKKMIKAMYMKIEHIRTKYNNVNSENNEFKV